VKLPSILPLPSVRGLSTLKIVTDSATEAEQDCARGRTAQPDLRGRTARTRRPPAWLQTLTSSP
jgi:hypothetical protein